MLVHPNSMHETFQLPCLLIQKNLFLNTKAIFEEYYFKFYKKSKSMLAWKTPFQHTNSITLL
jgi:hypothetical protein